MARTLTDHQYSDQATRIRAANQAILTAEHDAKVALARQLETLKAELVNAVREGYAQGMNKSQLCRALGTTNRYKVMEMLGDTQRAAATAYANAAPPIVVDDRSFPGKVLVTLTDAMIPRPALGNGTAPTSGQYLFNAGTGAQAGGVLLTEETKALPAEDETRTRYMQLSQAINSGDVELPR